MIKSIIFDWFGVCTKEFRKILSEELYKKFGINKKLVIKSYVKYEFPFILRKINSKKVLSNMFKEFHINKNVNDYAYIFKSKPKLRKDVFKLIKKLKANYKTALLSDNFDDMTKTIRKSLYLKRYFDLVVFSNEVGLVKRENKVYKFIIKKLEDKPKECVFIDDKKENIERAGRLGINGILFKNIKQVRTELAKSGVKI